MADLSATRSGDVVELRFTVPTRTTDDLLLRENTVVGSLCRQVGGGPCVAVDSAKTRSPLVVPRGQPEPVLWTDRLPGLLLTGAPRAVSYRVELRNGAGRTAGYSDPAYAAAGAAPPAVRGLIAEGTRLGIELRWVSVPGAGEILLQRTGPTTAAVSRQPVAPVTPPHKKNEAQNRRAVAQPTHKAPERPGVLWLQAAPGDTSASATMDGSADEGVPYTYLAVRRQTVTLGGRTLDLRSAPSAPVSVTWRDVYPPAAPEGLTALGYQVSAAPSGQPPGSAQPVPTYAVDLVWQPVNDPRLAGYVVYRQTLNAAGEATGPRSRLTPQPVTTPGFHDATAQPEARYRYIVTAIDPKGNESTAAETVVEPSATR